MYEGTRIYYTVETTRDFKGFSKNQAAMNELASNINRYSSVVNRFGSVPWAKRATEIRIILEKGTQDDG